MSKKTWTFCFALILGLLVTGGIWAQEGETAAEAEGPAESQNETAPAETAARRVIEEVIVTAQKREQSMQDVGIAISAFSRDAIDRLGVQTIDEMSLFVPNMNVRQPFGNASPVVIIRGVGLQDPFPNNAPTTGLYVDEVYFSSPAMASFSLFDTERVEVLKGPQGTLYGRNTTGGAVNYIVRKPSAERSGYVKGIVGNYSNVSLEGAIGGSLSGKTSGRISFLARRQTDGAWYNRETGNNIGEIDVAAIRGQLSWQPGDRTEVLINLHGGRDRSQQPMPQHVGLLDGPLSDFRCPSIAAGERAIPGECVGTYGYFDDDNDPYSGDWSLEPQKDDRGFGGSVRVDHDFDSFTFTSITGYEQYDLDILEETDSAPRIDLDALLAAGDGTSGLNTAAVNVDIAYLSRIEQVTQEFRLTSTGVGPLTWIVGAFFSVEEIDSSYAATCGVCDLAELWPPASTGTGADQIVNNDLLQERQSAAAYAHLEYQASDSVRLIGGLRYTREGFDFDGGTSTYGLDIVKAAHSVDDDDVSGKLGIDFTPSDDVLLFASASKGYKSGGVFGGFATDDPSQYDPYGPETLYAYELGFKTTLAADRVRLNGSAFYYDYKDQQVQVFRATTESLVNAGDSEYTGAELELVWTPTAAFEFMLGAGLLDAKIVKSDELTQSITGDFVPLEGKVLPFASDVSLNSLLAYHVDVGVDKTLTFQADVSYRSEYWLTTGNDVTHSEEDVTVVNGRIALGPTDGRWTAALWGKNLTDEAYRTYGTIGFVGDWFQFYNYPLTYGVEVTFNF